MRKLFQFLLVLVALVVIAAISIPILFKDQIFDLVKTESNNYIKGEVLIGDMDLSLFRNFPNLTLGLEEVKVTGEGDFLGISLVDAEEISVAIDLFSAFAGSAYEVKSVVIQNAEVYVLTLPDGKVNYDIARETEETPQAEEVEETESGSYSLKLKDFRLDNVDVIYDDRQSDIFMEMKGIDHRLSGDFSAAVIDMESVTDIESILLMMDKVSYLRRTSAHADINLNYVVDNGQLTLRDNQIKLNELALNVEGQVVMGEEEMQFDLRFAAPSTDFVQVLSLVPEVFYSDFKDIETGGTFALDGFVRGTLDNSESLPALGIHLRVDNGSFRYPGLPASAEDIHVSARIDKPQGTVDATVVDISKMSASLAGQPVEGKLLLKHPVSDPEVDLYAKTRLDLEAVSKIVPAEGVNYSGNVNTDLKIKGKLSDFESQNMPAIEASGTVDLANFKAKTTEFGLPLAIDEMHMNWSPQRVDVPVVAGRIGRSDFNGKGSLDNLISYVLSDTTLMGRFVLNSTLLDLNELASATSGAEEVVKAEGSEEEVPMEVVRIPTNLDMDLQVKVDKILYDDMELSDSRGGITLVDGKASLNNFSMNTLGGNIQVDGSYNSQPLEPEVLFDFKLNRLDVAQAFKKLDMLRSFAPIAQNAIGSLTTSFNFNSLLNAEMMPDWTTVIASGVLRTQDLQVKPDVMGKVATLLDNPDYGQINLRNARIDFKIYEGKMTVQPFDVNLGRHKATISGSNGLDQSLDYTMTTRLPMKDIKVPDAVADLGLTSGNIDVALNFGGTVTNPTVSTNFGDIQEGVKQQVQQVIQQQIEEARQDAVNRVNEEAEKILEAARVQAEKVKSEAKVAADKIRGEARSKAQLLRDEAKKQADALMTEAGSNPIKKAAAKVAGDKLIAEGNEKANQMVAAADQQAQKIEDEAAKRAEAIMAEAEAKAKIE